MLYQWVGISLSSRTTFVCIGSDTAGSFAIVSPGRPAPCRSARNSRPITRVRAARPVVATLTRVRTALTGAAAPLLPSL